MAGNPSKIIYQSSFMHVGEFRCPANHPWWRTENNVGEQHVVVFPRVPVGIHHDDKPPVIADVNCVMYYNGGQSFARRLLDDRGDECEFFAINSADLLGVIEEIDPSVRQREEEPFPFAWGPSDANSYCLQREICHRIKDHSADPMATQEQMFTILHETIGRAFALHRGCARQRRVETGRFHRELVEGARELLARRFHERLLLSEIASQVHSSPYHLSRVFREHTGLAVHEYINHLRLRSALEKLADQSLDLTWLALELGFSSHAHFTTAFKATFGIAPSAFRQQVGGTSGSKLKRARI